MLTNNKMNEMFQNTDTAALMEEEYNPNTQAYQDAVSQEVQYRPEMNPADIEDDDDDVYYDEQTARTAAQVLKALLEMDPRQIQEFLTQFDNHAQEEIQDPQKGSVSQTELDDLQDGYTNGVNYGQAGFDEENTGDMPYEQRLMKEDFDVQVDMSPQNEQEFEDRLAQMAMANNEPESADLQVPDVRLNENQSGKEQNDSDTLDEGLLLDEQTGQAQNLIDSFDIESYKHQRHSRCFLLQHPFAGENLPYFGPWQRAN